MELTTASSRLTTNEITLSTTMGFTVLSQVVLFICQQPPLQVLRV